MKKLFLLATAIFISGCATQDVGKVQLGAILPLTGGMAEMGQELQKSLIAEVEFLNKNGGILDRELVILFEDGQCNSGKAGAAAQKLIRMEKSPLFLGDSALPKRSEPLQSRKKRDNFDHVRVRCRIDQRGRRFYFSKCPRRRHKRPDHRRVRG